MLAILELQLRTKEFDKKEKKDISKLKRKHRRLQSAGKALLKLDADRQNRAVQKAKLAEWDKYITKGNPKVQPSSEAKQCEDRIAYLKQVSTFVVCDIEIM
jgi:hypothetical protein